MIKTIPYRGYKRLNYSSEVFCDKCGKDCTKDFHDIFINNMVAPLKDCITATNPYSQSSSKNAQYCGECINDYLNL